MTLPAGWALHPQNPQYMYEVANPQNVHPAPAAAPTPTAHLPARQQPSEYEYGAIDTDYASQQYDALKSFGGDREELWIDFDKVSRVGEESIVLVRLLPPWAKGEREANVLQVRHRCFAEYWPGETGKRQIVWPVCYNQQHGPGDCPIDVLIEEAATSQVPGFAEHVENFKPKKRMVWQGIDMTDPRKHWMQAKDPNSKMPIIGADGQPVWLLKPGFIGLTQTLHRSVLEFVRDKGDPTHPESGYVMKLKKRKSGREDRQVEYSAMDADHVPLDAQLRPVLGQLVDLRERFITGALAKPENMNEFCDAVRAKWGVRGRAMGQVPMGQVPAGAPGGEWLAHPQNPAYEYLPGTQQVRPRQTPPPLAVPAVPPLPQVPALAAPPAYQPPAPGGVYAPPPQPAVAPYPPGPPEHPNMPSMAQLGAPPHLAGPPMLAGPPPAAVAPPPGPPAPQHHAYPPPAAPGLSAAYGALPPGGDFPPPPPGMPPMPAAAPPGPPLLTLGGPPPPPAAAGAPPPPGPLPDGHGAIQGMTPDQLDAALLAKPSAPF